MIAVLSRNTRQMSVIPHMPITKASQLLPMLRSRSDQRLLANRSVGTFHCTIYSAPCRRQKLRVATPTHEWTLMPERIPQPDNARHEKCPGADAARPVAHRQGSCELAVLCLFVVTMLSGCAYDPKRFKLPEVWPRHPEIERRAAEYHDPFPDDAIGPTADSRPRGFGRQRSETRRAADLRSVHFLDGADRLPSTSHRPDRRFSQAVKP